MERWLDSSFFLPFKLNARIAENQYTDMVGDRVLHKPTISNGKTSLFLRFSKATEYVIRVTVLYKQQSTLALDKMGKVFKNYDTDQ